MGFNGRKTVKMKIVHFGRYSKWPKLQ